MKMQYASNSIKNMLKKKNDVKKENKLKGQL